MKHPVKVEIGHKWTTWDIKWDNCIGSMVGVSVIPLDYVTHSDITVGWTAANEHDRLKYQAIHIGLSWEANKMTIYKKLKTCYLYREG